MFQLSKKYIVFLLVILIGILSGINNIYAKNGLNNSNVILSEKYNGKKLDRIKNSIKGKKDYRFLISSNETLDSIKTFFVAGDNKAKVKQYSDNTFMVRLPLNTQFLSDNLSLIDDGILPAKLGNYDVIAPEIVEGLEETSAQSSETSPQPSPQGEGVEGFLLGEEVGKLWGNNKIGAGVFQEELASKGKIKVAVLDTGIDYNNADLDANYNSIISYDFVNEDNDAIDDNGHGTQVAGIIGAEVNGEGIYGINSNTDLVSLKVLDASGLGTTYDILEAIEYAKLNNVKVLNMSFGGIGNPSTSIVCEAITDAKANGIITVVSAGNNNTNISNTIPAGCADSITVGAIDSQNNKASFSNYGTGVSVYAPGVDIYSTGLNNSYISKSGTSFSAPFVSGLVAKELAFNNDINYDSLVNNIKNNYNLTNLPNLNYTENNITNNPTPIESGTGVFVVPENLNLYSRFEDFRYLSIDAEYVYYGDIRTQDKIYKLKLNNTWIKFPAEYYTKYPQAVFTNKNLLFPSYFDSGEYINISQYSNPELILSFSGASTQDNFVTNQFTPTSIGQYNLGLKFDKIVGKKILGLSSYPLYTDDTYFYYQNRYDGYKVYRLKKDGTDINLEGTKIINSSSRIQSVDEIYIYYQNRDDNMKIYRIKKDGSEVSTGGIKILDLEYSQGVYLDDMYFYYQNNYDSYKVYRIKKDGSEVNLGGTKIIGSDYSYPFLIEGDYMYYQNYSDNYKMYKIKKDGSEILTGGNKISDISSFSYILNDSNYIYCLARNYDGGFYKVNKNGNDTNGIGTKILNMFENGSYMPNSFFSDSNYFYYSDSSNERKIYKIKNDGSELNTGGTQISAIKNNFIFLKDGDYLYTSNRDNGGAMYKIKIDGTQEIKISGKFDQYVGNSPESIYYNIYNYVTGRYSFYEIKKDGTDTNFYVENLIYNSLEVSLPTSLELLRINVNSIIPSGTNYSFYLSDDNGYFTEIDKSKLTGTTNIDLINLFGTDFTHKVYFKIILIGDQTNTQITPIINSVNISTGGEDAKIISNLTIEGLYNCTTQKVGVKLNLYMKNSSGVNELINSFTSNDNSVYIPPCSTSVGSSWLWGSSYGYNTCTLVNITSDNLNFNINYNCTTTYGRTSSAAGGPGRRETANWNGKIDISKTKFDLCSYDSNLCQSLSVPTNLKQWVQSPELEREEFGSGTELGVKIGKFQSGSGIILSADIGENINGEYKVEFEVYESGITEEPIQVLESNIINSAIRTREKIVPYIIPGDFYWRTRVVDNNGKKSDWVDFNGNNAGEVDYSLFEGFEPYPYGYKFSNSHPADGVLTGGISGIEISWLGIDTRKKISGNKWEIFESVFPISIFGGDERKQLASFEGMGLNNKNPPIFYGGNCFGLSFSALNKYFRPQTLKSEFLDFYNLITDSGTIRNKVNAPIIGSGSLWNDYNSVFKTILAYQLYQKGSSYQELENNSLKNQTSTGILNQIKNYPNKPYLLSISGRICDFEKLCPTQYHAVVPYKAEGNKIYIWDNNVPFPSDDEDLAYNQYIQINQDGTWSSPYYSTYPYFWNYFKDLSLVDINEFYSLENPKPIGFNGNDTLLSFSGSSEVYFEDSLGRISGFYDGRILEEIPGIIPVKPLTITESGTILDNTWKEIYLPQKLPGLTLKVLGNENEKYDLMISGGDYYNKIEGVNTSSGQLDTFTSTGNMLTIDFDDNKIGEYNMLFDNYNNNGTGTVYVDSIKSLTYPQSYTIDWNKVTDNTNDAVTYGVDEDNDGTYETTIYLSPVFQDLLAPTTTYDFSGILSPNSTDSYIETTTITLQATDNEGGTGVDKIYYAIGTDTGSLVYVEYFEPIIINGVGDYALNYYSVDKFSNIETVKTKNFTLTEKPETYSGNISGFIFEDSNNNGVKDTGEKTMAGWKVFIDKNGDNEIQHESEPFLITNNDGYYEFDSLITGLYHVQEIPHQNRNTTNPVIGYYTINLSNGQVVTQKNFGNIKTKGGK